MADLTEQASEGLDTLVDENTEALTDDLPTDAPAVPLMLRMLLRLFD